MTISDWIMILAVLFAPLLAVQAQKRLEKLRESRGRKMRIFKTLMATRASTVSFVTSGKVVDEKLKRSK